jgi:mannose-6-phosphate isomerase
LNQAYPNDIGVLSPILLHLVELAPGQALYLPAGRLHAYLNGLAVEVMANSDNVLRGGLTSKHVDVEELLRTLDFNAPPLQVMEPDRVGLQEHDYPVQAEEFRLSSIHLRSPGNYFQRGRGLEPEIIFCFQGSAHFNWAGDREGLLIRRGESVFIPADVSGYHIGGEAVLFKAAPGWPSKAGLQTNSR